MSKSNMCLNVEFLAGTSLEDALAEAKNKACKFDLAYACFDFNGTSFSVRPNGDVENAIEKFTVRKLKHIVC